MPDAELLNLVYGVDGDAPGDSAVPPCADASPTTITIEDIEAAASRLDGVAHRTPVLTSRRFNTLVGRDVSVFFKCENFQRIGAFKFRGAYNALSTLDESRRAHGVITYSSGNHAQALALAARLLRIPAVIVMPDNAPAVKYNATCEYLDLSISGSEIVRYDPNVTTREELGTRIASERGLTLVKPYDNPFIIAGQGTAALELTDQIQRDHGQETLNYLFTPCGGGGLLSGSAIAIKSKFPDCQAIGVEPACANDAFLSFRERTLHTVHNPPTIADGARTPSLGHWTFPLVCEHVDTMMTVTDDELRHAMRFVMERIKIVIEPTAALPIAGLLKCASDVRDDLSSRLETLTGESVVLQPGQRIGIMISGGNVDFDHLAF